MSKLKDKTGFRYGRLIVESRNEEKSRIDTARTVFWNCRCDCGKITIVSSSRLNLGRSKSCGCLRHDQLSKTRYQGGKYISKSQFSRFIKSGKDRKLEFTITIEDIEKLYEKQNKRCALSNREIYFDITIKNNPLKNKKRYYGNASIDRIDSTKGYTIDNIQIVHKDVNFAKQSLSQQDFIYLCREITNHTKAFIENGRVAP